MRATAGANWNVIGFILDTPRRATHAGPRATVPRSGTAARQGRADRGGHLVERYVYSPYGELTVYQETGYGDRDGDVDATDKGTPGSTCTGTVSGECRILDLDFDGDYDSTDAGLFDSLPQGLARHPGRIATAVHQPFGHQGLLFEPELGQYQNRARQYDPGKRRFAQHDPLARRRNARTAYHDGMNLYGYLRANPLAHHDPDGLKCRIELVCWPAFEGKVGEKYHCEYRIQESAGGTGGCRCDTSGGCIDWLIAIHCGCVCIGCHWTTNPSPLSDHKGGLVGGVYISENEGACTCLRSRCSSYPNSQCYEVDDQTSNTGASCLNSSCKLGMDPTNIPGITVPGWGESCPPGL